ncbi:venom protein 302-like isoform X2 [Centruroides vittatus]|uniref:venom protein 302-like isoform X2 n=1 Tax=Centruroides vittatus TaxID=120091 RepID=UPI00350EDA60
MALSSYSGISALSCPCHSNIELIKSCKNPKNCTNGLIEDSCGCCKVCAKAENDKCGGPWHMHGRCGKGLVCVKPENRPKHISLQPEGTCKPLKKVQSLFGINVS